jgi:hypothetical protein
VVSDKDKCQCGKRFCKKGTACTVASGKKGDQCGVLTCPNNTGTQAITTEKCKCGRR